MNTDDIQDEEWDQEEKPAGKNRSSRSRRDRKLKLEQEIIKVSQDDMQKAREIVMIREELSRLHFKVKSYRNQVRMINAIVQLVIVILLLTIIYKLYAA